MAPLAWRQGPRLLCRHHGDEGPRGRACRRAGKIEARRGRHQRRQGSGLRQGQRAEVRHRQPRFLRHVRPRARSHGRQERSRFLLRRRRRRASRLPNARCSRRAKLSNSRRIRNSPAPAGRRIVRKNRVSTSSGKDYVAGFLFDVTEMKRREVEADEARKQLADVLERMPAGVVIYDRDDNFVFANRKLQESLPALKSVWQPGQTLRDAFEHGHSVGYFRSSGDSHDRRTVRCRQGAAGSTLSSRAIIFAISSSSAGIPTAAGTRSTTCAPTTARSSGCASTSPNSSGARRRCATRCARSTCSGMCSTNCRWPPSSRSDDLRIEYVNKAWTSISGISKEEAVGHTDWSCSAAPRRKATPPATPRSAPPARSWRPRSRSPIATAPSGS